MKLLDDGWAVIPSGIDQILLSRLRDTAFHPDSAGTRCLLDQPDVERAASQIRDLLIKLGVFDDDAIAIQAIAFDKTTATNWKVAWHQDLMFPFASPVRSSCFDLPTRKDNVDYARPPRAVLEDLLAVRLHLDDCDETNGPLRISPGTQRFGILRGSEVADYVEKHGRVICTASAGAALLMKPLTLHASSKATQPKHRRVLHFVYHSGRPIPERWHRSVKDGQAAAINREPQPQTVAADVRTPCSNPRGGLLTSAATPFSLQR